LLDRILLLEKIWKLIYSSSKKVSIVWDKDNLFQFTEIQNYLKTKYSIFFVTNPIDFRILYELKYKRKHRLFITNFKLSLTPDLKPKIHYLQLNYRTIFPKLETKALKELSFLELSNLLNFELYTDLSFDYEKTKRWITEKLYSFELTKDTIQVLQEQLNLEKQNIEKQKRNHQFLIDINTLIDKPAKQLTDWLNIMPELSSFIYEAYQQKNYSLQTEMENLIEKANTDFQNFLDSEYPKLFSLSPIKRPFLVTKIQDYIKAQRLSKFALIVIDGMSYWQWKILEEYLKKEKYTFENHTIFSYIPSITALSRQAIFKGNKPDIHKNSSIEGNLFYDYWIMNGYAKHQISYFKFGYNNQIHNLDLPVHSSKVISCVCNDLDDIMHGTIIGNEQLYESTITWSQKNILLDLLNVFNENNYHCFITTDHGNIEAVGIGNIQQSEKTGNISRSKRHIQFANETLMQGFLQKHRNLSLGKIDPFLYLRDKSAFIEKNQKVITHGGSHILEVLIPFIKVKKILD